jgi:hypothetical protein
MAEMCMKCGQSRATVDVLCAACNTSRETARFYAKSRQRKDAARDPIDTAWIESVIAKSVARIEDLKTEIAELDHHSSTLPFKLKEMSQRIITRSFLGMEINEEHQIIMAVRSGFYHTHFSLFLEGNEQINPMVPVLSGTYVSGTYVISGKKKWSA